MLLEKKIVIKYWTFLRTQGTPSSQAKDKKSTSYEVDLVHLACEDSKKWT